MADFTTTDLRLWAARQRPTCSHPWEFRTMHYELLIPLVKE